MAVSLPVGHGPGWGTGGSPDPCSGHVLFVTLPTQNLSYDAVIFIRWIGLSLLYALIVNGTEALMRDSDDPAFNPPELIVCLLKS